MFRILSNNCRDGTIEDDPATGAQTVEARRVGDNKLCVPAGDGPSLCSHGPNPWAIGAGERRGALVPGGDDAFAWLPRRDQDGIAARRGGSTRPSSSQDLVVCGEAPRVLMDGGIWDDKAGGSVLGCVGSAPERVEGSAGQGRQADERAGLLIMELGTHARMKHLRIVEWCVDRVNADARRGWNEG